jgi:hypothetical protein
MCSHRTGRCRLVRLAARFDRETLLEDVLKLIALDCPH